MTNVVYANRQVPGAVIAVPTTAFVRSQPVSRAAVRVTREMVASAPVAVIPPLAPTERSVRGAAGPGDKPPPRVFERPVVARTAPPAAHVGFAAQQQQLTATPGKPLDDTARKELKPAAAAPAPVVKVVGQTQKAPPTMHPPLAAPGAKPGDARAQPVAPPSPPPQRAAAPKAVLPQAAPTAPPPPPQRSAPAAPPQAAPPAPTAQPAEQRGKPELSGKGEQRGQPVAPPPPDAQKRPHPPQTHEAPQPPEVPKAPPPPVSVPRPPEAQKAPPPRPEAAKSAEKRGEKKGDAPLKLEDRLKREDEDKKRRP